MTKITQEFVSSRPLPEQTRLYFSHKDNLRESKNRDKSSRPDGPSYVSQSAFWNDWQQALFNWKEKLPKN